MKRTLTIVRHEFQRRVWSRGFILATMLGPMVLFGKMVVSVVLPLRSVEVVDSTAVAVVDETDVIFDRLDAEVNGAVSLVLYDAEEDAQATVTEGEVDGYLMLPEGVLTGEEQPQYSFTEAAGIGLQDLLSDRISLAVRT